MKFIFLIDLETIREAKLIPQKGQAGTVNKATVNNNKERRRGIC